MFKKSKFPYIQFLPLIIVSFLVFKLINNFEMFSGTVRTVLSYFTTFIWGFGIAYLLNPLMVYIEKKYKLKRNFSLISVYIIVIGFLALFTAIITPTIVQSITDLVTALPTYISKTNDAIFNLLEKVPSLAQVDLTTHIETMGETVIKHATNFVNTNLTTGLDTILSTALNFTSNFVKIIFGFIVSVYMLKDKEQFVFKGKEIIYAVFDESAANSILSFFRDINLIFSKYIIGKFIDSLIIAIICFVGLLILRVPYAPLISLIVGITNMIPYFGPFIGMVPAFFITLIANPGKAILVLIFIIFLQQFDGWYLGPKILGNQVGLSPFWIILGIVVGGSAFGVLGMFLGTPVMAALKMIYHMVITKLRSNKIEKENNSNIV